MMKNGYDYDIFPKTFQARLALAFALAAGGLVMAFYVAFWIFSSTGVLGFGWLDEMEVTYVNETDSPIYVYLEERVHVAVPANSEVTVDYRKIEWWFNRDVLITTEEGQVLFAQPLDHDDLEEMDFRLTVEREDLNACFPQEYPACLQAQDELVAGAAPNCSESDVCFVPLGDISAELVQGLAAYYEDEYGLSVDWAEPLAIPAEIVSGDRNQVDAIDFARLIETEMSGQEGSAVVIGLTNVDMYIGTSDWRYAFGFGGPPSVVSVSRMDPVFYGDEPDDGLADSRARKLVTKYIGMIHYNLSASDDPESPMFSNILSAEDLDRMKEPLPVTTY